jgi:hypothetical protein
VPDEQKPAGRDAEKDAPVVASATLETCLRADPFDSGRRVLEASPIGVQTSVSVKVDGGGQENPCHLPEARLREALLVTVLEEPLTLVRVRRDLVVHDVGYLSEQLLEHERPPLAERRPRVSGLCSVGKVTVGDAAAACARNI